MIRRPARAAWPGRAAAATALWLLAGCATAPVPAGADWITGRLSVRIEGGDGSAAAAPGAAGAGPQGFAAAFELRGGDREGELRLLSPLGSRVAQAQWSPGRALLTTSEGERAFASLDELALAALGERVPLAALPDWVAGRPWRGADSRPDRQGFEQLGWAVDTRERADGRIAARRAAPPAVTVRIRLDPPSP